MENFSRKFLRTYGSGTGPQRLDEQVVIFFFSRDPLRVHVGTSFYDVLGPPNISLSISSVKGDWFPSDTSSDNDGRI